MVIDKLWKAVETKTPPGPPCFCEFYLWRWIRSSQWISEKNPEALLAGEGKRSHFEIRQHSILSKMCPLHILVNRSPTDLEEGKYPTLAHNNCPFPTKEWGEMRSMCEVC